MRKPDTLFTPHGREFLQAEYLDKGRSTHEIAGELGTYANRIVRALRYHGLPTRDRSDAQKAALKSGRHAHPTKGKGKNGQESTHREHP